MIFKSKNYARKIIRNYIKKSGRVDNPIIKFDLDILYDKKENFENDMDLIYKMFDLINKNDIDLINNIRSIYLSKENISKKEIKNIIYIHSVKERLFHNLMIHLAHSEYYYKIAILNYLNKKNKRCNDIFKEIKSKFNHRIINEDKKDFKIIITYINNIKSTNKELYNIIKNDLTTLNYL